MNVRLAGDFAPLDNVQVTGAEFAAALFAVPDVDGALVGGASLTAAQFVPIIEAAARS